MAGTGGMGAFGGMTSSMNGWGRCIVIDFGKRRHCDSESNEWMIRRWSSDVDIGKKGK